MKILCLGNNTIDSDHKARRLATELRCVYHGLISDLNGIWQAKDVEAEGIYVSSVFDCSRARLLDLCAIMDKIELLDQAPESYGHLDAWLDTLRLCQDSKIKHNLTSNKNAMSAIKWQQFLDENHSFCVLPWIEQFLGDGSDPGAIKICCRSKIKIGQITDSQDSWQQDGRYVPIREKMLAGELLPHCGYCYEQEKKGLVSDRKIETLEWVNRLKINTLADLDRIQAPSYYEIRSSNRCNLKCRMCSPESSHRIAQEYKSIGIISMDAPSSAKLDTWNKIKIDNLEKIYVSGGEPLLNADFFRWLDQCKKQNMTKFECLVNTNGTRLPLRFRKLVKDFANMQFIFSIDGFAEDNDYIRWHSVWSDIVSNWRWLRQQGKRVHVNTTVSIYNVHRLSRLTDFIDREFPDTAVHMNLVTAPTFLSCFIFPDKQVVLSDLDKVAASFAYRNNKRVQQVIDVLINGYRSASVDAASLAKFLEFNDLLDTARSSRLVDYDNFFATFSNK